MTTVQSIIMGAVQGITEFLPISSSAHLVVVPWVFKIDESNVHALTYDVVLHFGTLLALLAVYARRLVEICRDDLSYFRERDFRRSLILKLIVGTIPAALCGIFFKDLIETQLRAPFITVFTLIAVSLLMFLAEAVHTNRMEGEITFALALIIGAAQAIALVPGVSRSGITITAAMLLGMKRSEAVDFSFLLSIPIVAGVSLYEGRHVSLGGGAGLLYLTGVLSAFLFGAASLKFLISYLRRHSLYVFACYRIGLAVLIVLLSL
ncbi:MAG: undecaprenyl-diphosphate phosphatase [Syntrophorhabdales bacterium]|jgi:undecaprenyl-diphosphatase